MREYVEDTYGEHIAEVSGDDMLVFGNITAFFHHMNGDLQGSQCISPAGIDLLWQWWMIACRYQMQNLLFCFAEQQVPVHHNPVSRT